ncbi:MAG: hypothetical protein R2865_01095 [Deinococcales bacterium]
MMATSTAWASRSSIKRRLQALSAGESALFLFPTKALSHDQLGKLRTLAEPLGWLIGFFLMMVTQQVLSVKS